MSFYYNFGTNLARVCFKLFARLDAQGREYVPRHGPLLIVSNHMGNADIPLITTSVPRHVLFMAKEGLFKWPVVSSILHGLGAYPLRRDGHDFEVIRWALDQLGKDRCVGIFPEGSRSRDGVMRRGSAGAAYLALKSQAPILPIALWGSEKIPELWRTAFAFTRLNIRIGPPFTLPIIEGKPTRPLMQHLTDTMMLRIAAMLPESHRGYYSFIKEPARAAEPCHQANGDQCNT